MTAPPPGTEPVDHHMAVAREVSTIKFIYLRCMFCFCWNICYLKLDGTGPGAIEKNGNIALKCDYVRTDVLICNPIVSVILFYNNRILLLLLLLLLLLTFFPSISKTCYSGRSSRCLNYHIDMPIR